MQNKNWDEIDNFLYELFDNNKEIPKETEEIIVSTLHRKKNKYSYIRKVAIIILAFSILSTSIVFAKDILAFIKDIFNLNTINIDNNNIVNAIDEKQYIQNVDMEYIHLNEEYEIKIDHLLLDDINLYMVFNLKHRNNIDSKYRISLPDLKITDNNNNILYDNMQENNSSKLVTVSGWKNIQQYDKTTKRELIFIMSNGFPNIEKININFSKIILYNKDDPDNNTIEINKETKFTIDLIEKFINKNTYKYSIQETSEKYKIKNAITSDTGTYILLETSNPETNIIAIYNSERYNSSKRLLGINTNNNYEFIIYYDISYSDMMNTDKIVLEDNESNKLALDYKK